MPRTNPRRREALADAAIELLATTGLAGVTHRALDRAVGVPIGTAANYFRSREQLLAAVAQRVVELHLAESERASLAAAARDPAPEVLVDLLTDSLVTAATDHRARYLAIFELQLESRRRPGLAAELAGLAVAAEQQARSWHHALAAAGAPEAVPALTVLYGGTLYVLVTGPEQVDAGAVRDLVEAMVRGVTRR